MKRIIIPTTYHQDTLAALRLATEMNTQGELTITLLTISELPDSITDLLFLLPRPKEDEQARQALIRSAEQVIQTSRGAVVLHHEHQYGVTRPTIMQVLDRLNTDMIIVPLSFQRSGNYLHKSLLSVLHNLNYPLMLLPLEEAVPAAIQRALYLHEDVTPAPNALAQLPFHVIHQSMLTEAMEDQTLQSVINKFNINLVVQSRTNHQVPQNNALTTELKLPVLTV